MNRTLILRFAIVSFLAVGAGMGVNTVVGAVIRPDGEVAAAPALVASGSPSPAARPPRAKSAEQYLETVMGKNIFDKAAREAWAARAPGGGPAAAATEGPSDLRVTLLGTVVAEPAAYSSALILEDGKPNAVGYGIGDKIYDREVVAIEPKRVTLKRGEALEYLTMDKEQRPPTPGVAAAEPSEDGVEQVGDNKWSVPRSLLDKYIGDLGAASKLGRALLHRGPDGNYDGYRLSAIRSGSLADQLGIKNGDVVHSVNGQSLDSMQAAMGAYNTMQNESNFCIDVTRRGEKQTLCYDVN